jgi:hypothetical protein
MIPMFNQGGRSAALLEFAQRSLVSQNGGFTYNDSPYVHALNKALQLEKAAVQVYTVSARRLINAMPEISRRTQSHFQAQRHLVKMIFAQRGLPDGDNSSLRAMASVAAAKASKYIPGDTVRSTWLQSNAHIVEQSLCGQYEELIKMAPLADKEILKSLLDQTRDFSEESM